MNKKDKIAVKDFLGGLAKICIGVVAGAAAFGVSPFDKGATMRHLENTLTSQVGNLFSGIDHWIKS
ncbi:MAG: hypothetical protein J6C22_01145 [Bacteroides sp.]|nr:hypothetical protein [Bacteroides sp.]